MNINLIDTLLEEQPFIDTETKTILSNINYSQVLGQSIPIKDKSELVIFASHLDQINNEQYLRDGRSRFGNGYNGYEYRPSNKYRDAWNVFGLDRLIISKKLLEFFMYRCEIYSIKKLFSMSPDIFRGDRKDVSIRAYYIIIDKFNNLRESEDGYLVYGESGSKIRYGKFINMINEMFQNGDTMYHKYRVKEIERSVDLYKARFNTSDYKICVLTGEDILYGYNREYQAYRGDTMLHQSCMNGKQSYLKLYTKNKKKIHLLVITDKDDKIVSRNLIWRLKKYNNFLFDRVYAADNFIERSIRELAESENWIMRNGTASIDSIKKINNEDGTVESIPGKTIKIKLNFFGFIRYPYLDTMLYQRIWSRTLTNKRYNRFMWRYDSTGGNRKLRFFRS